MFGKGSMVSQLNLFIWVFRACRVDGARVEVGGRALKYVCAAMASWREVGWLYKRGPATPGF